MNEPEPMTLLELEVEQDWVGADGWMLPWAHILAFDKASDVLFDDIGLDARFRERNAHSAFALEARLHIHRPAVAGQSLRFTGQVVDHDARFLHLLFVMRDGRSGENLAEKEMLYLFVDTATRRPSPMLEPVATRVGRLAAADAGLARPGRFARPVGLGDERPPATPTPQDA
jgi:acyl-CoA thioester hydrolase